MKQDASGIDDELIERIARDADADPRSVVRRLAGLPVRGRAGRRIDGVISKAVARAPQASAPDEDNGSIPPPQAA